MNESKWVSEVKRSITEQQKAGQCPEPTDIQLAKFSDKAGKLLAGLKPHTISGRVVVEKSSLKALQSAARSTLNDKAIPILKAAIGHLEQQGLLVQRYPWTKLTIKPTRLDYQELERHAAAERIRQSAVDQLLKVPNMDSSARALLLLQWLVAHAGLIHPKQIRKLLDLPLAGVCHRIEDDAVLTIHDWTRPHESNFRVVQLDNVAAHLIGPLLGPDTLANHITGEAGSNTRIVEKAVSRFRRHLNDCAGEDLALKGVCKIMGCYLDRYAGSLLADYAEGIIASYACNPVRNVRAPMKAVPPDAPARSSVDDPQVNEELCLLARIVGDAVGNRDTVAMKQALDASPFSKVSMFHCLMRALSDTIATERNKALSQPTYPTMGDLAVSLYLNFGELSTTDLDPAALAEVLDDVLVDASSKTERMVLSNALLDMQGNGTLPKALRLRDIPSYQIRDQFIDTRILTEAEYAQAMERFNDLSDNAFGLECAAFLILGLRLGLRPGEIARLRLEHIDTDILTIHVRGKVKTARSRRWLPAYELLSNEEATIIRELIELRASGGATAASHLFTSPDRNGQSMVSNHVRDLLRIVTMDHNFRLYQLRHSFASRLFLQFTLSPEERSATKLGQLIAGPPLPGQGYLRTSVVRGHAMYQLARLLGHGHTQITMRHYVHTAHIALAARLLAVGPELPLAHARALLGRNRTTLYTKTGSVIGGKIHIRHLPAPEEQRSPETPTGTRVGRPDSSAA